MALRFLIFFLVLAYPMVARGRWMTKDDATVVKLSDVLDIDVKKDGRADWTVETESEVVREAGREAGTIRIGYLEDSEELELIEAYTLNGAMRLPVPKQDVEDKAMSSGLAGFSSNRSIILAFPGVKVGSHLHLKYRRRTTVAAIPGFFSFRLTAAEKNPVLKQRINIRSALPLYWEPNDPEERQMVVRADKEGEHSLQISIDRPVVQWPLGEENPVQLVSDVLGGVVSTSQNSTEIFSYLASQYEAEVEKTLPSSFSAIAEEAAKLGTTEDRIDLVTSRLNEAVRYLGDWRSVRGRLIPRGHAEVVRSGSGDCKDFATSTAAILRKLGLDARIALVERGNNPSALPRLPLAGAFNHAIVRVRDEARTYWIDPTSDRSFARGIPEDIVDRKALVFTSAGPMFDTIPAARPEDSGMRLRSKIRWIAEAEQEIDWSVMLSGVQAYTFTGAEKNFSRQRLDENLIRFVAAPDDTISFTHRPYDLHSRVTKAIELGGRVRAHLNAFNTSAGYGVGFPVDPLPNTLSHTNWAERATRYYLGYPRTIVRETEWAGVKLVGKKLPVCDVDAPWLSISHSLRRTPTGVVATETMLVRARYLEPQQYRSAEFKTWIERLRKCGWPWLILEPAGRGTPQLVEITSKP